MSTPSPVDVSVVIPTRGSTDRIRVTLACVAANRPVGVRHEIVLVDDNHDGEGENLASVIAEFADLTEAGELRVAAGPRRGRAAARNAGASAARGAWLVFLDGDVLISPEFITAHANAASPGTFVHGRMRELPTAERLLASLTNATPAACAAAAAELIAINAGEGGCPAGPRLRLMTNALERAIEQMSDGRLPDVAPWLGCVGANVGMARADWSATGGFDERFGQTWGCEDLELGLRLHLAGAARRTSADAIGIHLSHARPQRWEQHARNAALFERLHPRADVAALPALLGPAGSPEAYVEAVRLAQVSVGGP